MLPWLRNDKHGVFLRSFRSEYSGLYLLQMIMGYAEFIGLFIIRLYSLNYSVCGFSQLKATKTG